MFRSRVLICIVILSLVATTGKLVAAPITDATFFNSISHTHISFENDGSGAVIPVLPNVTMPAGEYAADGLTVNPDARVVRDGDSCFRAAQDASGGSTPYGLQASHTTSLVFNPPVSAVGFAFTAIFFQNATFTAKDVNDVVIETAVMGPPFTDVTGACGFLEYGFVGISSVTPIKTLEIAAPSGVIDDLRFSSPDSDNDGIIDGVDNCPNTPNADQADDDSDALGNVCDNCPNDPTNDADNDGICGGVDNCPNVNNAGQANADGDAFGDACDTCTDTDGDGYGNPGFAANTCTNDNCPGTANASQANADGDALGDACDPCPFDPANDADSDGVCGNVDNCPNISNPDQANADGDVLGDACDGCPNDPNNDNDGDGVCGNQDNCPSVANPGQANADGDSLGDACDPCPNDPNNDIDGDGICGNVDNCPNVANPSQANADGDASGDVCDLCPNDAGNDPDGDGVCNAMDNCPSVANPGQANMDGDAFGDACDNDIDGDTLTNADEAIRGTNPMNSDSDVDGLSDGIEVDIALGGGCPNPLTFDSDGDGLSDGNEVLVRGTAPCNSDTDDDGVSDATDPLPLQPGVTSGFLESTVRSSSTTVLGLNLSNFDAANNNAKKARQNVLANHAAEAANQISRNNYSAARAQLTALLEKIDDQPSPPDWMPPSAAKTALANNVRLYLTLLSFF